MSRVEWEMATGKENQKGHSQFIAKVANTGQKCTWCVIIIINIF